MSGVKNMWFSVRPANIPVPVTFSFRTLPSNMEPKRVLNGVLTELPSFRCLGEPYLLFGV